MAAEVVQLRDPTRPVVTVEPILLDRRTAAKLLSISVRQLDYLGQRNELPTIRVGRRVLFSLADLREFAGRLRTRGESGVG